MTVHLGNRVKIARGLVPGERNSVVDTYGVMRVWSEMVPLEGQRPGDRIIVGRIGRGARFMYGLLVASAPLGASMIAVGTEDEPQRFRAAGLCSAPADVPSFFSRTSNGEEAFADETDIYLTIVGAALPAAGNLRVVLFYTLG